MDEELLINANDISRIKAVLSVMEPMQKYVTTLGSEKIVIASIVPPLIEKFLPILNLMMQLRVLRCENVLSQ